MDRPPEARHARATARLGRAVAVAGIAVLTVLPGADAHAVTRVSGATWCTTPAFAALVRGGCTPHTPNPTAAVLTVGAALAALSLLGRPRSSCPAARARDRLDDPDPLPIAS